MMYKIEQKIVTLARNAVPDGEGYSYFSAEDILFSHWEFNIRDGWLKDAWLAEANIEAPNYHEAVRIFHSKITRVISRISLISQSYIEFWIEPFLVKKEGADVAFFRYTVDRNAVGLMFMEHENEALALLLSNANIPEHFFYYWNDAVNTTGYSTKLLLMFSAIESLVKKNGKKDWALTERILGQPLLADLFGTPQKPETGLRHRLVHGEYFNPTDAGKNYMEEIHKKVISYFNEEVFGKQLLQEGVVRPHRHFFGNKEGGNYFIKSKNSSPLTLKDVLEDFDANGIQSPKNYEHLFDKSLQSY